MADIDKIQINGTDYSVKDTKAQADLSEVASDLTQTKESLSQLQTNALMKNNVKTINGQSIVGSGNIEIQGGSSGSGDGLPTNVMTAIYNLLNDAIYQSNSHSSDIAILENYLDIENTEPEEPEKVLSSITATNTLSEFNAGDTWNRGGIEVTAHYSDGTSARVDGWTETTPNMNTVGTQTITISYTENNTTKTTTTNITIKATTTPDSGNTESGGSSESGGSTTTPVEPSNGESNTEEHALYEYTINSSGKLVCNTTNEELILCSNTHSVTLTDDGYTLGNDASGKGVLIKSETPLTITAGGSSRSIKYYSTKVEVCRTSQVTLPYELSSSTDYYYIFRENSTTSYPTGLTFTTTKAIEVIDMEVGA